MAKKATRAYAALSKYKKKPWLLAEYGFMPYREEGAGEGDPTFYAQPIAIPAESRIGKGIRSIFGKLAKDNPGDEDLSDVKLPDDGSDAAELTGELAEDVSQGQLAFCDSGNGAWYLFVNVSGIEFVGAEDVIDVCPAVGKLVSDRVVYKTSYRE